MCCRNRLGVRLEGPAPKWARIDGGEGGSHPSNVHDHVYALGSINFTGNMPVRTAAEVSEIKTVSRESPLGNDGCLAEHLNCR